MSIAYTDTEELWLKRQFDNFQSEYLSVDPPKEYFEDLVSSRFLLHK
jgi:hypothetical protein